MVEAGRHSRWVEAQRKEKRQAASFAAPLDATGPQWENTAREKAVLCSCFTLSAKKNTPGLRLTDFTCFFVSLYPGWARIQHLSRHGQEESCFIFLFYYSSLFELVHVLSRVRIAAPMCRRNRAGRTLSGSTRSAGKEHRDIITGKPKQQRCCLPLR